MSKDLLKEAIADAKAVRETAIANAKLALEEAFTPKLQSMLSAKLQEDDMEDEDDLEDGKHEMRGDTDEAGHEAEEGMHADDETEEGMHGDDEAEEGMREEEEEEAEEGMREEDEEEAEEGMREEDEEEDDLDLESIIRELEGEDEEEAEEGMREASDSTDIGKGDNKMDQVSGKDQDDPGKGKLKEEEEGDDEEIDLDEVIRSLTEEDEDEAEEGMREEEDDKDAELEEAYNTIRSLKSTLQEVNLLNAKLLFSNKLFKGNNLSESQKMKVIETFDRASNLREVKLVYTTLAESFTGKSVSKKGLTEGFASRKSNSTAPKGQIVESNGMANRMKRLAGLL